jgi:biotin carboxyl carrier protein
VQAAIETYEADFALEKAQFLTSAVRGRPQVRGEVGRTVELRHRGNSYSFKVYCLGPQRYRLETNEARIEAQIDRLGQFEYWLTALGKHFNVVSVAQGLSRQIEVDGVAHRVDRDDGGLVHAPAPAVVVSIAVKPGDTVSVGDRLAVLEAMKMEMQVVAPFSGKVRQVMAIPNVQVGTGTPLLRIEPEGTNALGSSAARVSFASAPRSRHGQEDDAVSRGRATAEELRQLILGFDIEPARAPRLFAELNESAASTSDGKALAAYEHQILTAFVDICSLFSRHPAADGPAGGEAPSSEAYLFSYLRLLETGGDTLSSEFLDSLKRTLAHYGVEKLERTPELEEALLRIYKSYQRMEQQLAPVMGILQRRLEHVDLVVPEAREVFRALLERMISITRGRYPSVSDLAREVRYRVYDQALFEQAQQRVYTDA